MIMRHPLEPRETRASTSLQDGQISRPASISDATIQMDHNAVVLFTIDRLARSPRTTWAALARALERPQTGEL